MICPPCEITDQLAVGTQKQNKRPECTIARKKIKKILGRGHSPTGEGDTPSPDPTLSAP